MSTFIALLRGINVSGKNPVRMPALKAAFDTLGFTHVATYLQSGNVVFQATGRETPSKLAARIKERIAADFGHDVPVLVLAAKDLEATAAGNPLWPASGGEPSHFHATFLFEPVADKTFAALQLPAAEGERAVMVKGAVLLHCPHGYGRTKLNNTYFEKALKVPATTRNWKTVMALRGMCDRPAS